MPIVFLYVKHIIVNGVIILSKKKQEQKEITVKELNALAKKANARIRAMEKRGHRGLAYLTLDYDVNAGRAKRFSEKNKSKTDMERQMLYEEIKDFLGNNASTARGYRRQYELQETYDRVKYALEAKGRNLPDEINTDKEQFVNFLHSRFFKVMSHFGDSNDLIEIYLKAQDKHQENEIYKEFRAYQNKLIDLSEVSIRLTGKNILLDDET